MLATLKRNLRRRLRYHPIVERAQQKVRMNPVLAVPEIGFECRVNPGSLIIDCGANIGDITSTFARTGAEVYAFEPNPVCFSILSKRFSASPNIKCFNRGVMDK